MTMWKRRIRALLVGGMLLSFALGCTSTEPPAGDQPVAEVPSGDAPPGVPTTNTRVMTWNIRSRVNETNGWVDTIARYRPQVVALQETCIENSEAIVAGLRDRYGLNYHLKHGWVDRVPHCERFGQATLTLPPMLEEVNAVYPMRGEERRGYTAVTVELAGKKVQVFNTHLEPEESIRVAQAKVLYEAAVKSTADAVVVVGDFNAKPNESTVAPMWQSFIDADPNCGPQPKEGCQVTFPGDNRKLDYIFLRDIGTPGIEVVPTPWSDHHVVMAELGE
jgi:endonuclease/exonuclease/phosphatase family metal-dependent hydrolase